ncbi:hypothetical protein FGM00_15250 [Aggregatimonas sangjinii]|uniref:Uncharacterized protein n=1 Tax=Aggregatimonas sangjinii TaxID=2583587 RepID=A0A5B7SVR3_9FLAO|nr:DUF6428 family protein [Aggregatimonas sangjinii]QCX01399.1 hypothetical protein FGM00_15250 [Aggregatimonas sangjinii]
MKTDELLSLLNEHPNKKLLFEYTPGNYVAPNYHITEVKNITIDSVDCGAGVDFWKETIIQLWESPDEKDTLDYMTASKALGILNKVDQIKPMERAVEVKFEYSNRHFHTAQLFVNDVMLQDDTLMLKLGVEQTDCKARETCGVPAEVNNLSDNTSCAPGSGCC